MNATPDNTLADREQKQAMSLIRAALREYRTWATDSTRWKGFEPRPDDIIVATYPKCGTTWMQQWRRPRLAGSRLVGAADQSEQIAAVRSRCRRSGEK